MRRFSAVANFSEDRNDVLVVKKLRPAAQMGRANFPGGKVELSDWRLKPRRLAGWTLEDTVAAHRAAAARENREETGLSVAETDLVHFCTLRCDDDAGEEFEIMFFCCVTDVSKAKTKTDELVYAANASLLITNCHTQHHTFRNETGTMTSDEQCEQTPILGDVAQIPAMSNLSWLTAMALQVLRGVDRDAQPPFVVSSARLA